TKNSKWPKKGRVNESEVDPSVTVEFPQLDTTSKVKIIQETVKKRPDEKTVSSARVKENPQLPTGATKHCGRADDCVGNQNSELPSRPQSSLRKAYKTTFSGSLTKSTDLEYIDIDLDLKDPQLCSVYAPDIYNNLRTAELSNRPCTNFMETIQRDITQSMRGILVDWLVEVSEEYQLVVDTLYLTVHLVDCFLSQNYIERRRLQLLGITCMLIASKYEEICAPRVEEFCFITDNTYTREEVSKMETEVLRYFGFQVCAPTPKKFLRRFLRAAQASYKIPSLELEYLANYLAELALIDYQFLKFLPSIIAASAVFVARWTLDQSSHPWNPTLEHYTTYKASELKTSVLALQDLQLNVNGCPLNAVRMKYRQLKFKSVATLSSQKLLDTLF
ncbi:cyclin-A2-3-like, partial [Carica papaya]|uniref:cyclin-A2-3-like n=1 Tax=Carica papaya TaxID=3649 RepID=UPI000B8CAF4B